MVCCDNGDMVALHCQETCFAVKSLTGLEKYFAQEKKMLSTRPVTYKSTRLCHDGRLCCNNGDMVGLHVLQSSYIDRLKKVFGTRKYRHLDRLDLIVVKKAYQIFRHLCKIQIMPVGCTQRNSNMSAHQYNLLTVPHRSQD